MTKQELSQLYYLNREIEQDKRRLAELEAAATSTTPSITGLPHIAGVTDKTALAAEIADLKSIIEARSSQTVATYNMLMRYISTIDDCLTRQIITLRHVNGLTWPQIPRHIDGSITQEGIRSVYRRWAEKNLEKSTVLTSLGDVE